MTENYGGDPTRIMLAGQSAGGHLASVVLLQKALQFLKTGRCSGFQPKQLAGFCSISAPSDVQAMATNFQKHGLDQFFVQSLFGVRGNRTVRMDDYDPQRIVEEIERIVGQEVWDFDHSLKDAKEPKSTTLNKILPPMSIFHGTGDQTVSV
jgi:acetyl esterase/lipase